MRLRLMPMIIESAVDESESEMESEWNESHWVKSYYECTLYVYIPLKIEIGI